MVAAVAGIDMVQGARIEKHTAVLNRSDRMSLMAPRPPVTGSACIPQVVASNDELLGSFAGARAGLTAVFTEG